MNYFRRLAILLYVTLVLFFATTLLLISLNVIRYQDFLMIQYIFFTDENGKLMVLIFSTVLLLINYGIFRFMSVNVHRDKIIAFDNPSGRVSVSLLAMEDIIKRMLTRINEIKEVKPKILATRKGLQVKIRMVLKSEVNIPQITAKVQTSVLKKIQDTIGIDEPVDVSIYVEKILSERIKDENKGNKEPAGTKEEDPQVPFHGYRA